MGQTARTIPKGMTLAAAGLACLLSSSLAFAQQQDPKARAMRWATEQAQQSAADATSAQSELDKAKAAEVSARAAIVYASGFKDGGPAVAVAQQALQTALNAEALANRRIAQDGARAAQMQTLMNRIVPGATGLATTVTGQVSVVTGGQRRRWDGAPYAFGPGDQVVTGADGRANLVLEGGANLSIAPNSVFGFTARPGADPNGDFMERTEAYLKQGLIHLDERRRKVTQPPIGSIQGSIQYRTPTYVSAVRGTEFDMTATPGEPSRFTPISGEVVITADTASGPPPKVDKWWLEAPAAAGPSFGATLAAVAGEVRIEGVDGVLRPAAVGAKVTVGERVVTGLGGAALVDLAEHYRAALGPGARLVTGADKASGGALYALRGGRMHVWGSAPAGSLRFLTAGSVSAARAAEFEVTVDDAGRATFTPLAGSLDITAVAERLDWTKLDAWWSK